ncbi:prepilin-type N-terminal cleavage/methylation domain-containing protein [Clostridium bornimense]|uniref:type II secretion system protein n=1 Tax=Clostridium bornimense TaxID=1216932 RepID=UPI001C0F8165|nr:prepilin-type N-terminal cleavage/methylation domain-containing protein [Clostridium bornimense]MBU5317351.1 prepilin-type N-terminal cleavage/methylation domain-containing protein [Clostridium bornimense]
MNNFTKKRKKKGFTLVELMAVVAIIAILAVVLVPTVSGYIERSKKVAIVSQVRTVIGAVEIYNATASEQICKDDLISDLANSSTGKLKDDLSQKDINKLGSMDVKTARSINQDSDALKNIELNTNGTFKSFKGTIVTN